MIDIGLGLWWLMSICLCIQPPSCIKSISFSAYSRPILSDGLLIKGCAANYWQHFAFSNIFLFAAPLFSRFTHPPPPVSKERNASCWREGVGEEPNHMAAIMPMSIWREGTNVIVNVKKCAKTVHTNNGKQYISKVQLTWQHHYNHITNAFSYIELVIAPLVMVLLFHQ